MATGQKSDLTEIRSVCVFCGASTGNDPRYREHTQLLGKLLAEAGLILVYGGGRDGLMGVLADSALAAGGAVIGVIPEFLKDREHGHKGVTDLQIVDSMHSRKQRMFDLSDAFVVLPGGVGTLDETLEMITWKQLGRHDKPIVIANIDGYWQTLDALIATTIEHGFAAPATHALYVLASTIESVLDALREEPTGKIHTDTSQL